MTAIQIGQLLGYGVLLFVIVGSLRTLLRSDLTMKEKIFGVAKDESEAR